MTRLRKYHAARTALVNDARCERWRERAIVQNFADRADIFGHFTVRGRGAGLPEPRFAVSRARALLALEQDHPGHAQLATQPQA
jgi:hypothetical protein